MSEENASAGTPPAQEAPNAAPAAAAPPAPPVPAPTIAEEVQRALQPLVQKVSELEGRLAQPAPAPPGTPAPSGVDAEIQLRKDQLSMLRRGEIPAHLEPEIQEKLADAVAQKRGGRIADHETGKANFLGAWNTSLGQAYDEFPELRDQASDLYKEAKRIVETDPGYRRYLEVMSTKSGEKQFDWQAMDPRVNLRAAREAFAIVEKRKAALPQVPANRVKAGLEGGQTPPPAPTTTELDKLEDRAINSGDPMDWRRYIKAKDTAQKTRV